MACRNSYISITHRAADQIANQFQANLIESPRWRIHPGISFHRRNRPNCIYLLIEQRRGGNYLLRVPMLQTWIYLPVHLGTLSHCDTKNISQSRKPVRDFSSRSAYQSSFPGQVAREVSTSSSIFTTPPVETILKYVVVFRLKPYRHRYCHIGAEVMSAAREIGGSYERSDVLRTGKR